MMREKSRLYFRKFSKRVKMDSFAGSEPPLFISFHLGNEQIGQPTQEGEELLETDPNSTANTVPPVTCSSDDIEVYEVTLSSPEISRLTVRAPPPTVVKLEPQTEVSPILAAIRKRGGFAFSSRGSDESCSAYITATLEAMEAAQNESPGQSVIESTKVSESKRLELFPSRVFSTDPTGDAVMTDCPLTSTDNQNNYETTNLADHSANSPNVGGMDLPQLNITFEFSPSFEHRSIGENVSISRNDLRSMSGDSEGELVTGASGDAETTGESDLERRPYARSTLADALKGPVRHFSSQPAKNLSNESPLGGKRTSSLTIKSRELIRERLSTSTALRLSPGHPVIALNQEQIETVLRVVADETAKASIDMPSSVVEKASRLSWGPSRSKPPQPMHRPRYPWNI